MKWLAFLTLLTFAGLVALAQVQPRLAISRNTNKTVVISWPATNTGFVMQEATTPAMSNWLGCASSPLFDPTNEVFTVSVPTANTSRFYRLAPAPVSINLGTPQAIFKYGNTNAMGLFNVPDMHLAVLQQTDNSYLVWITGNINTNGGSVALLKTTNFLNYQNIGPGSPTQAEAVFTPSWDGVNMNDPNRTNIDSDYVGANTVITATNGHDQLMFYEAGTKTFGGTNYGHGVGEYNVLALARSTNNGLSWTRQGAVISGFDPRPDGPPGTSQPGISEPGMIATNGYMYMFFQYIPNKANEPEAPSVIQVARAAVASDGAPGAWTNFYNNSWSQPSLGGHADTIVATSSTNGCTRAVEMWPAYNTYLNAYVLLFLANEGWFFSTSTNLLTWTAPMFFMPEPMFQNCQPMDWNYIFVTPGNAPGVIGQTGYVLYAHTDQKGLGCGTFLPHELWMRPFTFTRYP